MKASFNRHNRRVCLEVNIETGNEEILAHLFASENFAGEDSDPEKVFLIDVSRTGDGRICKFEVQERHRFPLCPSPPFSTPGSDAQ